MSTHIPKPPPTTATTQAGGGGPRRRWWPFALVAALAVIVVGLGTIVVANFVVPQLQKPACTTAAHPERTGAISYYCPTGYSPGSSMTIGADGNVWFEDNNGKIARMVPQSGAVTEFAVPTPPNQVAGSGLVQGADGNIWYVANNTFGRITMSGQVSTFTLSKELGLARAIIAGSDGNLWVMSDGGLLRIPTTGPSMGVPVRMGWPTTNTVTSVGWSLPNGWAVAPDHSLWVVTAGAHKDLGDTITRITPAGSITQFPVAIPGSAPESYVAMLTAGPDNTMWFVDGFGHVGRITLTGVTTYLSGTDIGQGSGPFTLGPDGNIWFSNQEKMIGRITPGGVVTKFTVPDAAGISDISAGLDGGVWFITWYPRVPFQSSERRITRITP